jgi:hypothetical protein
MTVGDWSAHVSSWLDRSDVPIHVVSYEALKRNTARVFGRALRFVGEKFAADAVEKAVSFSDFRELSMQEKASAFRERPSTGGPFFRRGEEGAWRDELTTPQAARIVDVHGPVMERMGYLP